MEKEIRKQLIELARLKTTWTYSQLNEQLQLGFDFELGQHRTEIGEILGEISLHEHAKGRPLMSVLIRHQGSDREPGDGFFKLCESIYGKDWKKLKSDAAFEVEKIKECYEFWKNNDNYKNFKNDY